MQQGTPINFHGYLRHHLLPHDVATPPVFLPTLLPCAVTGDWRSPPVLVLLLPLRPLRLIQMQWLAPNDLRSRAHHLLPPRYLMHNCPPDFVVPCLRHHLPSCPTRYQPWLLSNASKSFMIHTDALTRSQRPAQLPCNRSRGDIVKHG